MKVFVFNVGQGDNILMQLPNGEFGLIDFFYDTKINLLYDEPPSLTYLKQLKEKPVLAFLHVSHYHSDHFKGIESVFTWIKDSKILLRELWLPGSLDRKSLLEETIKNEGFIDALNAADPSISIEDFKAFELSIKSVNEFIKKNPSIILEYITDVGKILTPLEAHESFKICKVTPTGPDHIADIKKNLVEFIRFCLYTQAKFIDKNNMSSSLCVISDGIKLFFGGDAVKSAIENGIKKVERLQPDGLKNIESLFIKVSHHGSDTSTSPYIWEKLLKKSNKNIHLAISAGNGYTHPSSKTISEIRNEQKKNNINLKIHSTNDHHLCDLCENEDYLMIEADLDEYATNLKEYSSQINDLINNTPIEQNNILHHFRFELIDGEIIATRIMT